ncbi:MAG: hypothetical protein IJU51_05950 [Clostridia bacterium]|nr:hypothetical protein [Clostridia bacterium]
MRYFTDEQLNAMRENARKDYGPNQTNRYLTCITRIELLDKRNDQFGDCRNELMQAIHELEKVTEQYVHRGRTDPNDEDADAFEYENYHY